MDLRWTTTRSARAAAALAPSTPGVYALGEVARQHGLVVAADWRYIGRATTQLGRRIAQHRTAAEKNVELKRWLASNPPDLEVWFASAETPGVAAAIERELIADINPIYNTLLKTTSTIVNPVA